MLSRRIRVPNFERRVHPDDTSGPVRNLINNWRLFIYTTVIIITLLLFPTPTSAQTSSLSIWPPVFETNIKPGQTITQIFRLKNLGDDTTITVQLKPFTPSDELGHITLGNTPPPSFFSLRNQDLPISFALKAGQTKELPLQISIPTNAKIQDHYLTFLFSSQTPGLVSGTGTTTQASIGSNLLLTVSSNQPNPTVKVVEFRTRSRLIDSFSNPFFTLKAKNPTPHFLKTIGQIDIKNSLGKSTTLPLRQDNILAGTIRQLKTTSEWNPALPFGRYSATVTLTPENSNQPTSQTIHFWFLPYKAILVILALYTSGRLYRKFKPST